MFALNAVRFDGSGPTGWKTDEGQVPSTVGWQPVPWVEQYDGRHLASLLRWPQLHSLCELSLPLASFGFSRPLIRSWHLLVS